MDENKENNIEQNITETPEISHWEEFDKNNSVVKKYIVYISADFIPIIDKMSTDERSAYINDAIQKKVDFEDEKKQKKKKMQLRIHFVIAVLTIIFLTPVALFLVNKAILATFDNYRYSQDNFERLYKHRFEKDKAFMKSIEKHKTPKTAQ